MNATIITIGDEILSGKTVDTNSSFISKVLRDIGVKTTYKCTVSDSKELIISSLEKALSNSNMVFITGGLGPTKDDLTMYTLAEYFDSAIERDQELFERLQAYFEKRKRAFDPLNHTQADFPVKAGKIYNDRGTATGMRFEKDKKLVFSMPGVPHEMQFMMQGQIKDQIRSFYNLKPLLIKDVQTIGIAEAKLARLLEPLNLESYGVSVAYLPKLGRVTLRFYHDEIQVDLVETLVDKVRGVVSEYIYSTKGLDIAEFIANRLSQTEQTLSLAESCTGGYLSHLLTMVPGSSKFFMGGNIVYSNLSKMKELKVSEDLLLSKGAVSEEVVYQMALNTKSKYGTDFAIAISGIAGPEGGSAIKPVGTVCFGLATPTQVITRTYQLGHLRKLNIELAAVQALRLLWKYGLSNK